MRAMGGRAASIDSDSEQTHQTSASQSSAPRKRPPSDALLVKPSKKPLKTKLPAPGACRRRSTALTRRACFSTAPHHLKRIVHGFSRRWRELQRRERRKISPPLAHSSALLWAPADDGRMPFCMGRIRSCLRRPSLCRVSPCSRWLLWRVRAGVCVSCSAGLPPAFFRTPRRYTRIDVYRS